MSIFELFSQKELNSSVRHQSRCPLARIGARWPDRFRWVQLSIPPVSSHLDSFRTKIVDFFRIQWYEIYVIPCRFYFQTKQIFDFLCRSVSSHHSVRLVWVHITQLVWCEFTLEDCAILYTLAILCFKDGMTHSLYWSDLYEEEQVGCAKSNRWLNIHIRRKGFRQVQRMCHTVFQPMTSESPNQLDRTID